MNVFQLRQINVDIRLGQAVEYLFFAWMRARLVKYEFLSVDGTRLKVRGPPKVIQFILRGP